MTKDVERRIEGPKRQQHTLKPAPGRKARGLSRLRRASSGRTATSANPEDLPRAKPTMPGASQGNKPRPPSISRRRIPKRPVRKATAPKIGRPPSSPPCPRPPAAKPSALRETGGRRRKNLSPKQA